MGKGKKAKRRKMSWSRYLIHKLINGFDLPASYCFRLWLFELVKPKNLTVKQFCYVPGEERYELIDPDVNRMTWGSVKVGEDVFQPLPEESLKAIISPKTCIETSHQSA